MKIVKQARTIAALASLHESFKPLAAELIELCHASGINVQVTSGRRSWTEQNALFAQGRTEKGAKVTNAKGGESLHNFGLAIDVVVIKEDGKPDWGADAYWTIWRKACVAGLDRKNLWWSGLWEGNLKELLHFQLGRPDLTEVAADQKINKLTGKPLVA